MTMSNSDKLTKVVDKSFVAKTEQAKDIQQNVKALSNKLDVDMDEEIYFVNKIMGELLNNKSIIKSEAKYNKRRKELKAQGKKHIHMRNIMMKNIY